MIDLRGSGAGIWSNCGASTVPPEVPISISGEAADLGTAFHCIMASYIPNNTPIDEAQIELDASVFNVDVEELTLLARLGWNVWQHVKQWFPDPIVEEEISWRAHTSDDEQPHDITITGHPDILSIVGKEVRILDWKTGWLDADAQPQLMAYAKIALENAPWCDSVYAVKLRTRDGQYDPYGPWSRDTVNQWWERVLPIILDRQTFRPGAHCGYCQRAQECPGRRQMIIQAAETVDKLREGYPLVTVPVLPKDMQAADLANIVAAVKTFRGWLDQVYELAKLQVKTATGMTMEVGDGRTLSIKVEERKKILAREALPLLQRDYPEHFTECLEVGKTKLESIIKESAPARSKAKAVKAYMEKLELAGAVSRSVIEKLELRTNNEHGNDQLATAAITQGKPAPHDGGEV